MGLRRCVTQKIRPPVWVGGGGRTPRKYFFALREVSVLAELTLGHLRYLLTDVPPQSNSPPDTVFRADRRRPRGAERDLQRENAVRRRATHAFRPTE